MDAVKPLTVGQQRDAAGARILSLADELALGVQGCFWLLWEEGQRWQFHMVTPLVEDKGPRWIYDRLLKVFAKVPLPQEITPLDIFVMSPEAPLFREFLNFMSTGEGNANIEITKALRTDRLKVRAARIYRLRPSVRATPQKFDMKVRQLLAA